MDPSLIADEALPLSRKARLPGEGFFLPEEPLPVAEAVADTVPDRIVLADPDPDGLACVAIIEAAVGDVALVPAGPHELEESLESLASAAAFPDELFVCDLAPDPETSIPDSLATLDAAGVSITWFDHHQWDPAVERTVRDAGVALTVGDSDEECTADVAVRTLATSVPDHLRELAAVTRDHDLWIKDDPRSDDLADYAYWSDPEEYVAIVAEHGPDLPEPVLAELAERREEKVALIDLAVANARIVEIGSVRVGVTYGRCSQNEVAERLRKQGADAAVIVKPAGSASIRGSEAFEGCHLVAERVNGGGHPRAAGCKPDIYDDVLDYATHWVTEGATAQRVILDAFEAVVRDTSPSNPRPE